MERTIGDFAAVQKMAFRSEEPVDKVADGGATAPGTRLATRVQVILLVEIPLQSPVRVVPFAKVNESAADFLRPSASGVGEERKFRIRLGWFLAARCGRLGHLVSFSVKECISVVPLITR